MIRANIYIYVYIHWIDNIIIHTMYLGRYHILIYLIYLGRHHILIAQITANPFAQPGKIQVKEILALQMKRK